MTGVPVPEKSQVLAIRRLLIRHTNTARRALNSGTPAEYAAAMAEARVCQNWLDVYVDRRKDAR